MYLVARVIFELLSGKFLGRANDKKKIRAIILGTIFMSVGYVGFATTVTVLPLFIFYGIIGMGLGVATPLKNSLFSTHLDKNKEVTEWSIYDGFVFMGMAMSAIIGGFVANRYGFPFLFVAVAATNLLSIIPYLFYGKDS